MVLELTRGVGYDVDEVLDIGQVGLPTVGVAGVGAIVGLADGPGLGHDEAGPAVLGRGEAPILGIADVAGSSPDEPEGPQSPTIGTASEATVGERVVRR